MRGVALLSVLFVACGGRTADEKDAGVDAGCMCETTAYGSPGCYPTTEIGTKPGSRIENFAFKGLRAPGPPAFVDTTAPLTDIRLSDYYDPEGRKYRLIWIVSTSAWAHPQSDTLMPLATEYWPRKVVTLRAWIQGSPGVAATENDVRAGAKGSVITGVLDPTGRLVTSSALVPISTLIDARSMEILAIDTGAINDTEIGKWIDHVDTNPAHPGEPRCNP